MSLPRTIALGLASIATCAGAAVTTTVVDVPSAGASQRFLYVRPDAPVANIVSIPGGDGVYGIQADGTMGTLTAMCGPISRNRQSLAEQGFSVALVDANSAGVVYGFGDIQEVVRYMQARDNVPTWIVGGSASTAAVANVAVNLPAASPVGVVFYSPMRPSALAASILRPALVVYHVNDTGTFGSAMFNALTAASARERAALSGGSDSGCGYHLFNGLDAQFVATTADFIRRHNAFAPVAGLNFQGLWYRAPAESESGWGVNLAHQGDALFATWFTYDTDGSQMWLVGPAVTRTTGNTYSGALYRTTGPAFDAVPFGAINFVAVGTATFNFTGADTGTFAYDVNGVTQTKAITRQVFDAPPTCAAGGTPGATPNFSDLWYRAPAESEPGWGVNLTQQGNILFATWFTYDSTGRGMWIVGPRVERTSGNTFAGALFRTTGPAFNADPWSPAGVAATPVGTATFSFTDANNGTFSYTVNGIGQVKSITRQVFASPPTVCR